MSRRALEPVDRITGMAGRIGAQDLAERLPLRGANDELDRLSETLNAMFGRLESAFQRITQFTADASHELRTPVAVIRTTAELTRSKPRSDAEYCAALDRILAESERTTRLIEDLLLLARADSASDAAVLAPVDLPALVRDTCADAAVLAEAAGVRLLIDSSGDCQVAGDEDHLRRLLLVLLDNAIQYTPAGGEIRVSVEVERAGGAVIEVRDTGIGIAPEDLPHIFERFYRASKDRSRKTGGAGLGLSIAQWIAHRHGGKIVVESTLGTGSSFRVELPRPATADPSAILQTPPAE
jgi:heavy metal sensor kinase